MEEFWSFARDYWWLVFPLGGAIATAIGGASASWERAATRRHARRMEAMRLRAELAQAKAAGRSGLPAPGTPRPLSREPEIVPSDGALSSAQLLERLFAEHDEITARWLDYELDVAKLIAFPAMSDGRQPLTAAFLRAKRTADTLRPDSAAQKVTEQQVSEYLDAVGAYAVAFEIAEKDARRLRDSGFTPQERERLDRAQKLLMIAIDSSATQAERNIAYKRVRDELDGLISLSDEAVDVLEKKVALSLLPGTPPSPDDQPAAERRPGQDAARAPEDPADGGPRR